MKIEQKPKFQPITITLETSYDADAFADIMGYYLRNLSNKQEGTHGAAYSLAVEFIDWFSDQAQLGGK